MTNPEYQEFNWGEEINLEDCAFFGLSEIERTGTQEFFQVYPALREKGQIIKASDNFVLIPDIAPVTKDYLLLVPKNHFPSFSSIPPSLREEAIQMISDVINRMKEFHPHSEIIAFEHGVGTIEGEIIRCGGCGRTDHAHLHMLPVNNSENNSTGNKIAEIISQNFKLVAKKVPPLPALNFNSATGRLPYLYLWSNRIHSSLVFIQDSVEVSIPSQLIRRLLATEILGVREEEQDRWDWRDYIIFHAKEGEQMISDTLNRWIPKLT